MIDSTAHLEVRHEPFLHYRGSDLLVARDLKLLDATKPDGRHFERLDRSTGDVRRRYRLSVMPLLNEAQGLTPPYEILSAPWGELIRDLLSDRFADWIRQETGFEPQGMGRTSSIFVHRDGDFQDLNTGKLDKKLHVALQLNEDWPSDGGGAFEFWSGPDRATGPHSVAMPVGGTCIVYSPTPSSWHRTAPVAEDRGLIRTWITLSYFDLPKS
ncbi:2OG-Fe(II) oxygenase [Streptomyces anulatus]|uniref:2OG-Fe(II) oxygenase n=1 Tax=Streptomyces anulatus TaxID=1892 RepID=UPI0033C8CA11